MGRCTYLRAWTQPTNDGSKQYERNGRDAAERLAKQIITSNLRRNGTICVISDLDGKNLGALIPALAPYVIGTDELGKWRSAATTFNQGSHDAAASSSNALVQALGNLRAFKKAHKEDLGADWVS